MDKDGFGDRRLWTYALAAFGAAYGALRFFLWRDRFFNPDELYYLHSTYCTAHGLLIFRDYFEFHGPFFPWLLSPLVGLFHDPVALIFAARAAMLIPYAIFFGALWSAAESLVGRRGGWLSLVLLSSFTTFAAKSIEIRPDVPAVCFFYCAVALSLKKRTPLRMAGTGVLLGIAFFFTPKVIYPGVGWGMALLWEEVRKKEWKKELFTECFGPLLLGAILPLVGLSAFFLWAHALSAFIQGYFLYNKSFPRLFTPWVFLVPSLKENAAVWLLALAGLFVARPQRILLIMTLVSVIGLFHLVLPYEQYYLLLAPLLCMLAASTLLYAWDRLLPRLTSAGAIAVLLVILLPPLSVQVRSVRKTNAAQLEQIRCVLRNTKPNDRVLDFWTGASFARPHAFATWALPRDLRRRFDPVWLEGALLKTLADPRCRAFIWDDNFEDMSETLKTYARQHYHSAGCGALYLHDSTPTM